MKQISKRVKSILYLFLLAFLLNNLQAEELKTSAMQDVRLTTMLSSKEKNYLNQRDSIIQTALKKFIDQDVDKNNLPRIAFCCSGGGFRAMYATLGLLLGAREIGLLDLTSYIFSLSGSSWCLFPWLALGGDLDNFKSFLLSSSEKNFLNPSTDVSLRVIEKKYFSGSSVSTIDFFGMLLAEKFLSPLGQSKFTTKMSELAEGNFLVDYPLPFGTAVYPNKNNNYEWLEFSPLDMGGDQLRAYIETQSLGKKFFNGSTINDAEEIPLCILLAIFGSAFSLTMNEMAEHAPSFLSKLGFGYDTSSLFKNLQTYTAGSDIANQKLITAKIPNLVYGIANQPMSEVENLLVSDGGHSCNIPFAAALRPERKIDLIVILDVKHEKEITASNLVKAEVDAKKMGLKFPEIDYVAASQNLISVFSNEKDLNCPTVIYIPLKKNSEFSETFDPSISMYQTTNFTYTKEQVNLLVDLIKHIIVNNKKLFEDTLKTIIDKKSKI